MKITGITTYRLESGLGEASFYSSQCLFERRVSLLVEIATDEGTCGWGECGQYGPKEPIESCIHDVFAPMLIGRDPTETEPIWNQLYCMTRDFGQKGCYIEALSGIDIANWDIRGKALGVPVHSLLGGAFRTRITPYATGCYYGSNRQTPLKEVLAGHQEEASGYIRDGFNFIKVKIGLLSIEEDNKRLKAIREAVGDDVGILVDANHAYRADTAVRMGRILEEAGVLFFEEPVPPEDYRGYAFVRGKLDLAIAGGECEYTRYGFSQLMDQECVDIVQPDICVMGGLSEFQKVLAMATVRNKQVIPHVWGSGVAVASSLHAIAAIPPSPFTADPVPLQGEPVVEFDRTHNPLRDELLAEKLTLDSEGKVSTPTGPGLGIEIDRSVLEKYTLASRTSGKPFLSKELAHV